ncbi:MAG: ParB/RepB/Spo0J family partition protein [Stenomitos rutilans HA7619-LM2]|jgi:ParB family chromosome partitioning protein|nr:ParB/RepB/Spo0J family partition protein [Stenomitos rutilans HA7619-LM2]
MSLKKPPASRTRLKNVTLFNEEDEITPSPQSTSLDKIKLPEQQPRRYFDPEKLAGLVESIKQHGILEPLLVRPLGASAYELVAGERRYRAATEIGLTVVPIVIREMSDSEALQIALIENLQREDLNPVEETEGILQLLAIKLQKAEPEVISLLHRMLDEAKGKVPHNVMGNSEANTIQQVFEGIALMEWQSFVSNRLPLLKLPSDILLALRKGLIAYTKAQAIARIKDEPQRTEILDEAITQDLSLARIKERIAEIHAARLTADQQLSSLKHQFEDAYRRIKKSRVWDAPQKKRKLEKLLEDLNAILADE